MIILSYDYTNNTTIMEHFHLKLFLQLFCHLMVLPSNDNTYYHLAIYDAQYLNQSKNGLDHIYIYIIHFNIFQFEVVNLFILKFFLIL